MNIEWSARACTGYREGIFEIFMQREVGGDYWLNTRWITGPFPKVSSKRHAFFLMDYSEGWRRAIKETFPSAEFNECWIFLSDADVTIIRMMADYTRIS